MRTHIDLSARDAPDASATTPTRERILQAAETLLRRFGPAKTTVVDVARALDMSHANVYRHFASKAVLHDAVAERWLARVSAPLGAIATGPGAAADRLEAWVLALGAMKRRKVLDDPEMFATYHAVAEAAREVVEAHRDEIRAQLVRIVRDGVATGEFAPTDPEAAARAVMDATARFHQPHAVRESAARGEDTTAAVRRVLALLIAGLRAGVA